MKYALLTIFLLGGSNAFASDCNCNGETGYKWTNNRHQNPSTGGCVSYGAYLDESVFLARSAKVCGDNVISGNKIRIIGDALVTGTAEIDGDNVLIGRGAVVGGTATIGSDVKIIEKSITSGHHSGQEYNGIIERQHAQEAAERNRLARQRQEDEKQRLTRIRGSEVAEIKSLQTQLQNQRRGDKDLYDFYFSKPCVLYSYGQHGDKYYVNLERNKAKRVYTNFVGSKYLSLKFDGEPVNSTDGNIYEDIGIQLSRRVSGDDIEEKYKRLLKSIADKCWALQ